MNIKKMSLILILVFSFLNNHTYANLCSDDLILSQNIKVPKEGYLRDGDYSKYTGGIVNQIKILQKHLKRLGYYNGNIDGIIGPKTRSAVLELQKFLGTQPDGIIGPKTRELLNNSCDDNKIKTTDNNKKIIKVYKNNNANDNNKKVDNDYLLLKKQVLNNRKLINSLNKIVDADNLSNNKLSDLGNVFLNDISDNDLLSWNGNKWINVKEEEYKKNLYNTDGILNSNRTINLNGNTLSILDSSQSDIKLIDQDGIKGNNQNTAIKFWNSSEQVGFIGYDSNHSILGNVNNNGGIWFISDNGGDESWIRFSTGGVNARMFIDENGKIGINTTEPTKIMDINGESRFRDKINIDKNKNIEFKTYGGYIKRFIDFHEINNDGSETNIDTSIGMEGQGLKVDLDYLGNSNWDNFEIRANGSESRFYIDEFGSVGINNKTPGAQFDIKWNNKVYSSYEFIKFRDADGNVKFGFGTNNRLSIYGTNPTISLEGDDSSYYPSLSFNGKGSHYADITAYGKRLMYRTSEHWFRNLNGDDLVRIKENGNVGIGTTDPQSKLAVVGLPEGANANDAGVSGNPKGVLCITDNGNLWIDTDTSDGICN